MVARATASDPTTIHDYIESSSQYEINVVVVGFLGDQSLTGRNCENLGALSQFFGQFTIAGDEALSRESV